MISCTSGSWPAATHRRRLAGNAVELSPSVRAGIKPAPTGGQTSDVKGRGLSPTAGFPILGETIAAPSNYQTGSYRADEPGLGAYGVKCVMANWIGGTLLSVKQ